MILYNYGMRLRGFSIGCQPMEHFYEHVDDANNEYWDIISYTQPLSDFNIKHYSLIFLGTSEV
jgi:hypothetical protein